MGSEHPLISILIPFKNTVSFLSACLGSIQAQTYRKWEVIAVDDHSTDNSVEIASRFAKYDPRIRVLANQGSGIIPALRTAYAASSGIFVTRMDSDDIMLPHRLASSVASLSFYGPGTLAIGGVRYFSDRGISDGYARYETWLNRLTAQGSNFSEIYKECVVPSPCWMTSRDTLEMCGAFRPDRYPEDYDLAFRFYANGLRVIPCTDILHFWRDYDSRTSRTSVHYAQNYFLDIKLHYFLELDFDRKRPLVIWGAGFKGKKIAQGLQAKKIPFTWVCDNPLKIGKKIYGQPLFHFLAIADMVRPQSVVTVANETAQSQIRMYLNGTGQQEATDFFFFC